MTLSTASGGPVGLRAALRQRLIVTVDTLGLEPVGPEEPDAEIVQRLALHAKRVPESSIAWLLFIALSASFPTADDLAELRRSLDLATEGGTMIAALGATLPAASRSDRLGSTMRVESGSIVVDVNFCATHEHNTGIQRVVRQTIPRWLADGHELALIAWTPDGEAMRDLDAVELDRVLHWDDRQHPDPDAGPAVGSIVVPWKSNVFLPEVPLDRLCAPLAALAESSGNRVSLIGYDAIPLVSAESQRAAESQRFANYLSLVKHSDAIFGISESAAGEFSGFVSTLPAQGLSGPAVTNVPLAVGVPGTQATASPAKVAGRDEIVPLVVCIGSHEPRKNQDAVLHAAHTLFRQGQKFRMVFVGGGDRSNLHSFDKRVRKLRASGYDVSSRRKVTDSELWGLYREARFSVFVSLHEGFGLPVAESLALGTPALTSNYGSLAEIAEGGGCVTVDPRSDDQVIAGMRKLLTDDKLVAKLRAQAAGRRPRGWDDYARELWTAAALDRELP
ncbi:MAG TPA: glycosyltransferase [Terrimesophilobacter sp.]|nr:glycosyltransferase [Terrimesophilobacter sp.]